MLRTLCAHPRPIVGFRNGARELADPRLAYLSSRPDGAVLGSPTLRDRSRVPLLSDADVGIRADVAVAMASRMDRVSAPALLALVTHEEMLEPWRRPNVVQAINILTGTYFRLTSGTPSPALRTKAVTDFGQ